MVALAIESSNSRGMGHLFRSLLIVKYMRDHKIEYVYLINNDKVSHNILEQNGIDYIVVDYDDKESSWENRIILKYGIDVWINDKFETSVEMAKNIKKAGVYFVLIDDIGPGEKEADVNFIGLIGFSKKTYESKKVESGMKYVILNDEINIYKRRRSVLKKIIVSFGGSDPHNNTVRIVKELLNWNYDFDVVIGPNYKYEYELRELSNGHFHLYKNTPSLIKLFSNYDLAITGGGVTCCEANAAGLPCVIIANAPHEINTGRNLEKYGGCIYAGDYEKWDKEIWGKLADLDLRKLSDNGMHVFDTKALDRIFQYILDNCNYQSILVSCMSK